MIKRIFRANRYFVSKRPAVVQKRQYSRINMAKVFVTRRIPDAALDMLRNAPEVAEVRVNPENRVLTRQGT